MANAGMMKYAGVYGQPPRNTSVTSSGLPCFRNTLRRAQIDRAVATAGLVDALAKTFAVNVGASIAWTGLALEAGLGRREGAAVVNITSVAGLAPAPPLGAYGASKAALIHVTAQLALELAPAVRVNAVAPAVVKTAFARLLYEGRETDVAASYPLGRLGVPQDVAAAVAFLASPDASWITGQTLVVDGGVSMAGGLTGGRASG